MIEGLTNDEQGGFRAGKESLDQIFILKQMGEKALEKSVCGAYRFKEGLL